MNPELFRLTTGFLIALVLLSYAPALPGLLQNLTPPAMSEQLGDVLLGTAAVLTLGLLLLVVRRRRASPGAEPDEAARDRHAELRARRIRRSRDLAVDDDVSQLPVLEEVLAIAAAVRGRVVLQRPLQPELDREVAGADVGGLARVESRLIVVDHDRLSIVTANGAAEEAKRVLRTLPESRLGRRQARREEDEDRDPRNGAFRRGHHALRERPEESLRDKRRFAGA